MAQMKPAPVICSVDTWAMYATGGGVPQPAESTADARRIALDGQAYTWPQYVEAYGDDAQRCWDDAYDRDVAADFSMTATLHSSP